MPRPPLPLFLLAFACMLLAACGTDHDAAIRAASDPKRLLAAYASGTGVLCAVLCVRRRNDLRGALIDAVKAIGALTFAVSPLYSFATGNATAGLAMAVSGIASFACATVLEGEEARRTRRPGKKDGKKR